MIKEIEHAQDTRKALGRGGYIVTVSQREKDSRIHSTDCSFSKQLRKSFGAGGEHKRKTGTRYFHSENLKEAQLFWVFERVEQNVIPCEKCKPCGNEAPGIPDCDRELYDWMRSEAQAIANMCILMYKFIDAYAVEGQSKEAFMVQARVTRRMAESGAVRAVEISDGHEKDVDILLDDGSNIQVWRGRYEPDYESEREGHEDSRVYERSKIETGAISHKLNQLPDGEKGFVVNLVPGDTMYGPPDTLLTEDKCVISSEDNKQATIYRAQSFRHAAGHNRGDPRGGKTTQGPWRTPR